MISQLTGTVISLVPPRLVLDVHGVGFAVIMPTAATLAIDQVVTVYTHLHWTQEKGPQLYGFSSEQERIVFLLIIDVPKIGPSVGVQILSQISAEEFVGIVLAQDSGRLSLCNGIGPKKAQQLVSALHEKVQKGTASGALVVQQGGVHEALYEVQEALRSLGYSHGEIQDAVHYAVDKAPEGTTAVLLKNALGYLATKK